MLLAAVNLMQMLTNIEIASLLAGNNDVLQITGNSTRTCSGALSMASVSVVSVAALAAAVALAM